MTNILSDIEKMSQILGKENIDCLTNLFEEMTGQPPCVNKKRYRADHIAQIESLNYLENSIHFIRVDKDKIEQYYYLPARSLPLIKTPKAQSLLNLMCEIYQKFSFFYQERLDAAITKEELLKAVNAPTENILEALYYFRDTDGVCSGWGDGFPYKENSQINLSEDVLLKKNFLEILTDYYRWNFIKNNNSNTDKEIEIPQVEIEDKKIGRPSHKEEIISLYESLKEEGKLNFSQPLIWNIKLIRETFLHLNPHLKNDLKGLGDDAISNKIRDRFNVDRETYKVT